MYKRMSAYLFCFLMLLVALSGCGDSDSPTGPGGDQSGGNGPAAPGNVRKTAISATRLELSWEDKSTDELGFIIEQKATGKSAFAVIDTVGPNVTTYVMKATPELPKAAAPATVVRGLDGEFRVVSYNVGGRTPSEPIVVDIGDLWYRIIWVSLNIQGVHVQDPGEENTFDVVENYDFSNNTSCLSTFLSMYDEIFFGAQVTSGTVYFFELEFTPFTDRTWELMSNPVIEAWWDDGDMTDDDFSWSELGRDDFTVRTVPGVQGESHSTVPTSVVTIEFNNDTSYSHQDNTVTIYKGSVVRFEVQHLNEQW